MDKSNYVRGQKKFYECSLTIERETSTPGLKPTTKSWTTEGKDCCCAPRLDEQPSQTLHLSGPLSLCCFGSYILASSQVKGLITDLKVCFLTSFLSSLVNHILWSL